MGLTWWPLFRDCTYYILGLLVLATFSMPTREERDADSETAGKIAGYEAVVLFALYLGYVFLMYKNDECGRARTRARARARVPLACPSRRIRT